MRTRHQSSEAAVSGRDATRSRLGRAWLLVPVAIALVVFVLSATSYPTPPVLRDALGYTRTAQRLLADGVFSYGTSLPGEAAEADAFVTPGYVWFLAGAYAPTASAAAPADEWVRRAHPLVLGAQLLLALGTVACIALSGRSLGGRGMGITAGVFGALYLAYGWAASVALSESLGAFLISAQLLVSLELAAPGRRLSPGLFALLGGLAAAAALVRPAYALWVLLPLAVIAWRKRAQWPELGRGVVVLLTVSVLLMMPWWVRNALVLDEFIPLSDGGGAPMLDLMGGRDLSAVEALLAGAAEASGEDPNAAVARARMKREWRASPTSFMARRAANAWSAVTYAWNPVRDVYYETQTLPDQARIDLESFPPNPTAAQIKLDSAAGTYHQLLLLAALASLFFVRRSPRLLIALSLPVYAIGSHFFTLFLNRYFFPSMAGVVVLAGASVYAVATMLARRVRWRSQRA